MISLALGLMIATAVICLVLGVATLGKAPFLSWFDRERTSNQRAMNELFMSNITPDQVVLFTLITAVIVAFVVWGVTANLIISVVAAGALLFLPKTLFDYLRETRRQKFDEQLPDALDQLSSGTKAGLSAVQAFEETSKTAPNPIAQELGLIVRDYRVGSDLKSAIELARNRIGSRPFGLAATALIVNIDKGGNLVEALERIARSLKEIWRLEQKVITATAQARKGVRVISLLPVGIFVMISLIQPDIVDALTSSFLGWVCISISCIMYFAALLWFRRILRVDI